MERLSPDQSRPSFWSTHNDLARAGAVVGLFYAVYVGLTWRFIGIWWGDYGLWLHEVDRVASGEIPYLDFSWEYPPLALYVFGIAVRLFGSDVSVVLTLAALICFAIFASVLAVVRTTLDRSLLPLVALGTLLTSVAYSSTASETLAAGMYTPAAPLGGLLLILSVLSYRRVMEHSGTVWVIAVGVLCALAVLTKPDFWLPSLCVFGFAAFEVGRKRHGLQLSALLIVCPGLLLFGVWLIVREAGWTNFTAGLGGYSVANEELGRMLPSWERIVAQLILLGAVLTGVTACLRLADAVPSSLLSRWLYRLMVATGALVIVYLGFAIWHVWPGLQLGVVDPADPTARFFAGVTQSWPGLIGRALSLLARRLRIYGWPLFLAPAIFVWLVVKWRSLTDRQLRQWLLFLLCLSMAGRARRLFEHVDWYNFLFEVPALLLAVRLAFQHKPRVALVGSRHLAVLILLVGSFNFFDWTLGPVLNLEAFGRPPWGAAVPVRMAHGWIRVPERDAEAFKAVTATIDRIDPSGVAPVFSIGIQGPWPYYTGRRNPTPLTYGFSWSNRPPEQVLESLIDQQPHAIVIGENSYEQPAYGFPRPELTLDRWDLVYQEYYHTRLDGPYYRRLLTRYEAVGTFEGRLRSWTVYRWKQNAVQ